MFVALNNNAGIITISDLPQKALLEIRDFAGKLIRRVITITPSFTMDSEKFNDGRYTLVAICTDSRQEFCFSIKNHEFNKLS